MVPFVLVSGPGHVAPAHPVESQLASSTESASCLQNSGFNEATICAGVPENAPSTTTTVEIVHAIYAVVAADTASADGGWREAFIGAAIGSITEIGGRGTKHARRSRQDDTVATAQAASTCDVRRIIRVAYIVRGARHGIASVVVVGQELAFCFCQYVTDLNTQAYLVTTRAPLTALLTQLLVEGKLHV